MQYYVYGPWAIFFRGRYAQSDSSARMKDTFHHNNNLQTNFWYTPLLAKCHFGPLGTGLKGTTVKPSKWVNFERRKKHRPLLRPWSVDSLDGGSTDAIRKPPIGKKIRALFFFILASRLYLWNYWAHRDASPIKLCRILQENQPGYFLNQKTSQIFWKILKTFFLLHTTSS